MSEFVGHFDINRRDLMVSAMSGAGVLLLPQNSGAEYKPRHGGSIKVATQATSTADTLDPAKGALSTDYVRHFMLYNGLTKIGPDLIARPSLAKSFESIDLKKWHFILHRGIRFHDGSELTSADVIWSLNRHFDARVASKMATIIKQFAEIKADGRYDIIIELSDKNADLPSILAQSHFLIVKNGDNSPKGNGTGPFKLAEFKPGVRTVVVKNHDYWIPDRPYLDRIELIAIPDEVSRVNALLSGDIQIINAINPRSTKRIKANKKYDMLATPSALYTDLIPRQDMMPTGNPDFVKALKYLVDRPLIKRALFRNFATIGNDQPIPPFHPFYNNAVAQTSLDLDRAKWHLKRSGFDGVRIPVYAAPAAEGSVDMASIMQEYGSRIGLKLAVNRVPSDGYWSTHWMRHALTFGNVNPRPTADLTFSLFFKSDAEWNESGWKNERFDKLLIAARGEAGFNRRKQMYGEMQQLVHDYNSVIIPVFISLIDGFDRRVKGLKAVPLGGMMAYQFAEYVWWDA